MRRPGHTRPIGTTWRMRLHSWKHDREPSLGDLVFEDPEELKRGFLLVGVEETSKPTVWRITLERLEWGDFMERLTTTTAPYWCFVRDRR